MPTRHRCPRCLAYTDEKFYCRSCRDSLKRPFIAPKRGPYYFYTNGREK